MATEPATVISTYIHIIRLDTKSGRDFISPCRCRDTSNYVHRECLDQWRAVKVIALLGYLVYKIDTHQRFWLRLHWGFGSDLGFYYVCGEVLDFCAKGIILKLADWMIVASGGAYDTKTAYARGCWGLLPAFCHCPSDVHKKAQALTTLLIPFLKESSFMLENISAALQELVNKNKNVLASDTLSEELIVHQTENENLDLVLEFKCKYSYSKKSAGKNIKALASCSEEWLQALVNVFCESSPAKY
ncbi:hypothetical protein T459_14373 [Capsicum annuum]|uniref:RING-CH-type domain-containing protein n=1 Tax=Capsicum annuum TaxID=4072 RepID=A0A2G2ZH94_CAPAN|nr:hypothetical protein T459_14373 [Capsicum annuum]